MPTEPYAHGALCPVVPHLSLERLYILFNLTLISCLLSEIYIYKYDLYDFKF